MVLHHNSVVILEYWKSIARHANEVQRALKQPVHNLSRQNSNTMAGQNLNC